MNPLNRKMAAEHNAAELEKARIIFEEISMGKNLSKNLAILDESIFYINDQIQLFERTDDANRLAEAYGIKCIYLEKKIEAILKMNAQA